jgi:hypothetical protein
MSIKMAKMKMTGSVSEAIWILTLCVEIGTTILDTCLSAATKAIVALQIP